VICHRHFYFIVLYDAEREMGYARRLSHAGPFQFDGLNTEVLEQPDTLTQQDRDEIDVDFIQEAQF
jgi:hypothetical protein